MQEFTPVGKIVEFLYRTDFTNSIKEIETDHSPENIIYNMMEWIKDLSKYDWDVDSLIVGYQEVYQFANNKRDLPIKKWDAKLLSDYINEPDMEQVDFQKLFGFDRVENQIDNIPELNR